MKQTGTTSSLSLLLAVAAASSLLGCGAEEDPGDTPDQRFAACERTFTITEPVDGYAWTPRAIVLESTELSPRTFAIYDSNAESHAPSGFPLATSGGFVIGDDGVLLVETMINRQLFCQAIDLVRARTDQPIRYAINTSHHGDHSYGNQFLPPDVQVVQHEETAAFIADPERFAADKAFMEANFGDDQGIDEIHAYHAQIKVGAEGWSIDLGGVHVDAHYLGFGQTDGDLFVHVREDDVLFTGNPVVARTPAIPWLLDGRAAEVATTLAEVQDMFPTATVVPGHDAPRTAGVTTFSVDYLNTLIAETQAAVDAGQTLEQAVDSITMEPYQGYALWGWVHKTVNVPATYAELSGP
jgi:glyoxylase-like metal-dependent hydrolase (beta-lactamase superfamily II)